MRMYGGMLLFVQLRNEFCIIHQFLVEYMDVYTCTLVLHEISAFFTMENDINWAL